VRKSLLEYDEVMDSQRKTIYTMRQQVLESVGLREKVEGMLQAALDRAADVHKGDAQGLIAWFQRSFGLTLEPELAELASAKLPETARALDQVRAQYDEREKEFTPELMRRIEQYVLLNVIDTRWKDHLHAIDALKTGIGLRGYGQLDPKNEYKREGYQLFDQLKGAIEDEVAALILRIQVRRPSEAPPGAQVAVPRPASPSDMQMSGPAKTTQTGPGAQPPQQQRRVVAPRAISPSQAFDVKRRADAMQAMQRAQQQQQASAGDGASASEPASEEATSPQSTPAQTAAPAQRGTSAQKAPAAAAQSAGGSAPTATRAAPNPAYANAGRNDPCPCGSGKKFKKCHGQ